MKLSLVIDYTTLHENPLNLLFSRKDMGESERRIPEARRRNRVIRISKYQLFLEGFLESPTEEPTREAHSFL